MKKNYKVLLVVVALSVGLLSFIPFGDKSNPEKDKMLIELLSYVLENGHYNPIKLDDNFSKNAYKEYLKALDVEKRYFTKEDIDEFSQYQDSIDDFVRSKDLKFFELSHSRLMERVKESKGRFEKILSKPFNFNIDESINVDFEKSDYAVSTSDMNKKWEKRLKWSVLSEIDDREKTEVAKVKEDPAYKKKSFEQIEEESREAVLKNNNELLNILTKELTREDWFSYYLNAIVTRFDPHTFYFSPENKEKFDVSMSGKFEGIGARLQKKNDVVEVSELISGGPAWKGKQLEQGDLILKVAQGKEKAIDVAGMRLDDVVKKIKGPKGTEVRLTVKKVDGSIKVISIVRDVVETEETFAKSSTVIKDGKKYGIIYLPKFYISFENKENRDAYKDVALEISRLKEQQIEGLIMDLRDNGGGSLETVVNMVGLFIDQGPVVQVKHVGSKKSVLSDKDPQVQWDGPLVVLVNNYSASASEIFAAAIQDYKRGVVIGSKQTYGKGTVQNIYDLNNLVRGNALGDFGALKTTTQKFYRINGGSTQKEGVNSDIVLPDRLAYIVTGEKDEDGALPWDKIDGATYNTTGANFDLVVANSKIRVEQNDFFKLVDAYSKEIKERREDYNIPLNYKKYKAELEQYNAMEKKYEWLKNYTTNLTFESLPYEQELFKSDPLLMEKRKRWHEDELAKDAYVDEALSVLNDIKVYTKYSNYVSKN